MAIVVSENARRKVANGVKLLDEKVPGWWKAGVIDLETLEMKSCFNCMLGQLFGYETEKALGAVTCGLSTERPRYADGGEKSNDTILAEGEAGYHRGLQALDVADGSAIGCNSTEGFGLYPELKCAWAEVIAERRAADEFQALESGG